MATPNLFDGSMNFQGKKEYVPLEWMDAAVETILRLMDIRRVGADDEGSGLTMRGRG